MTAALLPPDPTKPGRYWLAVAGSQPPIECIAVWVPAVGLWTTLAGNIYPRDRGYTLASPHPIPTAAQLDALWSMTAERQPGWSAAGSYERGRQAGIAEANTKLRAALKGDG